MIKEGFEFTSGMIAAIVIIILIIVDIGWMMLRKDSGNSKKDKSQDKLKKLYGK